MMCFFLIIADLLPNVPVPWTHIAFIGGSIAVLYGVTVPVYIAIGLKLSGPPPFSEQVAEEYGWIFNRYKDERWYEWGTALSVVCFTAFLLCKDSATAWTITGHDGPNHLGVGYCFGISPTIRAITIDGTL